MNIKIIFHIDILNTGLAVVICHYKEYYKASYTIQSCQNRQGPIPMHDKVVK